MDLDKKKALPLMPFPIIPNSKIKIPNLTTSTSLMPLFVGAAHHLHLPPTSSIGGDYYTYFLDRR
ncbi:hypothetical protein ES332_D02G137800v1 [Gossypium tomentosum]|uniref:Uncharacterized protein n=1 Tax=Gossypium tomentosum TaxID=34277 RepID=A0A5D2LWU8_GOSTO|nr:hypothetical protein ES332_D02G137800v1 [Gossypium tomentosum]